ncbi:MAG: hypothetical protein VB013_03355 [Anaerolineaceae bacterium]|nr:hypothetical protein [Anaerolineaceae bacterium]
MLKGLFRQISVVLAVIVTITINTLADVLPINGLGTGEISDAFKVFFVPSGYVFSIWGIIYLGLIAFAVYQALPAQKHNTRLDSIDGWFLLSSLANCVWIYLWHYQLFVLTLLAMAALLISLIMIYLKLDIGKSSVSSGEKWWVRVPFSIYLGWVSVATVANVSDVLYYLGWTGGAIAPQVWAAVLLAVATLLGALMAFTRRDTAYVLVLVWAFIGIALKFPAEPVVSTAAWVATALAAVLALYTFLPAKK